MGASLSISANPTEENSPARHFIACSRRIRPGGGVCGKLLAFAPLVHKSKTAMPTPAPSRPGHPRFALRNLSPSRKAISLATRRKEAPAVMENIAVARLPPGSNHNIADRAAKLVAKVRAERSKSTGVDALMHEFTLGSAEGIALMCLAEALLRIPDHATADRLIRDKIARGRWDEHLGLGKSLFVNAAAWGLMITGKWVMLAEPERELRGALARVIERGGEPIVRKAVDVAMRMMGGQFVIGETINEALENAGKAEALGYTHSYDMLGEAALTREDAEHYFAAYAAAIHAVGKANAGRGIVRGPGISVKLSALHPRYCRAQRERVLEELLPRLRELLFLAMRYDIGFNIDAEEADRLELSLDLIEALARDPAFAGWNGLGIVVQAYQKRCPRVLDHLIALARETGHRFMLRLVKGAYWDAEIKRAQMDGQDDYPVYTRKIYTDVSYLACAKQILAHPDAFYPQFATHNAHTLAAVLEMAGEYRDFEFQCLFGMGETLYDQIVGDQGLGLTCRIYAPVGAHENLLAYLVRRLLENGANSSFVNRIVDPKVSIDELVADPVAGAEKLAGAPHALIPLPAALYGPERGNSRGRDLTAEPVLAEFEEALEQSRRLQYRAAPLLAEGEVAVTPPSPILNPANREERVGVVFEARPADVAAALRAALAAAASWAGTPPAERAACLVRAADRLAAEQTRLVALIVREAGKSLANAINEVREAEDFCRYYAAELLAGAAPGTGIGPVVCISPWNFPLAIFMGGIAANLAAGNPVLAKPAEQTPLIAAEAVRILHAAGVPRAALQLLPGAGETVGAQLTAALEVRGVVFTGSTQVARLIQRALYRHGDARRVLIAETGGQNAMLVDSSALPEQVVNDVIASAFDSAGQRCSALRVLCLQRDIADRVLAMLIGAMQELRLGDPAELATDVGPVIDPEARDRLLAHIELMRGKGRLLYQCPLQAGHTAGYFVAPTLIEIERIGVLEQEVFGPVLHVLRFGADEMDSLLREIRNTGYGLTLGVHSRIDLTVEQVLRHAAAGNVYVNRNMIGAVVGVQPFGGEGLSGTGPKAGGPWMLPALQVEGVRLKTGAAEEREASALTAFVEALSPATAGLTPEECGALKQYAEEARRLCASLIERVLPGPTGERNQLFWHARGEVLCRGGATAAELGRQIIAALATENTLAIQEGALGGQVIAALLASKGVVVRRAQDAGGVAAVLCLEGDAPAALSAVCAMPGAVIPVIVPDASGRYPLWRLLHERSVSINTAAAGGNASLLAISA